MGEKATIMIVDDDSSLCRTMSLVLSRKGYAVHTAQGGLEAIERAKEMAIDIIFMDVKMPGMDGVEAYKVIKGIKPGIVVTMMTAYAVDDLLEEAMREGAQGVMYKPLDMDKVICLIEEQGRR
jgi:DNA-binding NtrC family response regulator